MFLKSIDPGTNRNRRSVESGMIVWICQLIHDHHAQVMAGQFMGMRQNLVPCAFNDSWGVDHKISLALVYRQEERNERKNRGERASCYYPPMRFMALLPWAEWVS